MSGIEWDYLPTKMRSIWIDKCGGMEVWKSLSPDEKDTCLEENLTENELDEFIRVSRLKSLNQDNAEEFKEGVSSGGGKKNMSRKRTNRKRKRTRRRRYTSKKSRYGGRKRR